jgi:hypothetical protein
VQSSFECLQLGLWLVLSSPAPHKSLVDEYAGQESLFLTGLVLLVIYMWHRLVVLLCNRCDQTDLVVEDAAEAAKCTFALHVSEVFNFDLFRTQKVWIPAI